MKSLRSLRCFILLNAAVLACVSARADLEVTTSVSIHATAEFEAPLATHGTWVEFGSHGRCWRPGRITVGWSPYCTGEWVWTDCGWYWQSDEPWAWACYHYGSWVHDPVLGWVWVPGVEWAPAWVSWRVGGGYIGWAPLPPRGVVFASQPRTELFVFVGEAKFGGPIRPGVLVVNSSPFIKSTILVGGLERGSRNLGGGAQKVFVNNGPSLERVQKATGKTFTAAPIRQVAAKNAGPSKPAQKMAANQPSSGKNDHGDVSDHGPDKSDNPHSNDGPSDHGNGQGNGGNSSGGKAGAGGNSSGRSGHGKH